MIELEIQIPSPPAQVWERLTANEHLSKWWGEGVTLEPRQGGKFYEPWIDAKGKKHLTLGSVTAFEPLQRLQMNWGDSSWEKTTRVEILLHASNGGTKISLQHSGWDIFADEKERKKKVDAHTHGWQNVLENLRQYCHRK